MNYFEDIIDPSLVLKSDTPLSMGSTEFPVDIGMDFWKVMSCGSVSDYTNALLLFLGFTTMTGFQGLLGKIKPNPLAGMITFAVGGIGLAGKYMLKVCDSA